MPLVEKSVLIERTPAQMFELVDRVEDYPQFLPWCGGTQLHERDEKTTAATLRIAYRGINSQFSTVNQKEIPHLMLIHLREGPFSKLEGRWRFTPLGDAACKVEFHLHYEFSSRMLAKVLGPVFNYIADSFVESFVKRARQVYGG
jgi:ribosome-associated toxin RatA of RatAB toxin-antitoxin module